MKEKKQLLILVALVLLLLGAASATDVSDDATDTANTAEDAVEQTQTATDTNNIATQVNEEREVERDTSPENDVTSTQGIQKNTNKDNTKEDTQVKTWYELSQKIKDSTSDRTISLQDYMRNGGTIILNNGIAITIDGNGKTINGNQQQVFNIKSGSTLILKNITITNATSDNGGAIKNEGTLSIIDSTLNNNTATYYGGAIYNDGTLTITHTTLNSNSATDGGGSIYNSNREYFTIINSNFIQNHAGEGGAIYSYGYANLTGNIFSENTAENNETIDLKGWWNGEFKENQYKSTDISLNKIELSLKDDKQTFIYNEDIELNLTLEPEHSNYYGNVSETKIDRTFYINGEENVTTTSDSYTLSNLKPGTYAVYYSSCNQQSNTVTFKIIPISKENDVYNYTQLIDAISEAKNIEYTLYTINLHPGNYNATDPIEWGNSATRNIIINGNGITLDGNNTYQFIKISNEHNNLTLNNVTITNYKADFGGAILNYGTLTITYTTFVNNTAKRGGGAIVNSRDDYFTIINSNFIQNHAKWAAAIYSQGFANLTGNIFSENTATDHNETIDLLGSDNGIFKDNHYKSTDILLNRIELSLKDDKQTFMYGKDIELNLTLEPKNSINYYHDISEAKIDRTIFINGVENVTITGDSYTLSNLEPGTYSLYYASCNQQSNIVTFKILGPKQNDVYNYTQLIDAITEAKTEEYPLYTINLHPGNYNATDPIEWGDSVTHNIVINGNGLTLDGKGIYQFIRIGSGLNLTLNDITITNYRTTASGDDAYARGGAIYNRGNLTITHSTLKSNHAMALGDYAYARGGAIYNAFGNLNIMHSTLVNNQAIASGKYAYAHGGAIFNDNGNLNIMHSTIANNQATASGQYAYAYGGAIYSTGNNYNITDTTFHKNSPENFKITEDKKIQLINGGGYISIGKFSIIVDGEEIANGTSTYDLTNKDYGISDDSNIVEIIINGTDEKTLNNRYVIKNEIITSESVYDYYDGLNINVTVKINDNSREEGTLVLSVKDGDEYCDLLTYHKVKDGYNITTETIAYALKAIYDNLNDFYIIKLTYSSDYVVTSSTEFTLNIIKQRNTSIIYDIINNTEGNVQINITVTDTVSMTPVNDATIRITGDITQTAITGIITDTSLTPGSYTISVLYDETENYKSSEATINFDVVMDKDKIIEELEEQLSEITAPKATNIVFDSIDAIYNSPVTVTGELTDDKDNGLNNKNIIIRFNGKTYDVITKRGSFVVTFDSIKSMKEQRITASFEGDDDYNASESTVTFMMKKQDTELTINEITGVKYHDIMNIAGTFKNANGQLLINSNVKVNVNGQFYTVKTDGNGVFALEYKVSTVGVNNITVSYAGNSKYNACETTTIFNVDKKDTVLTIDEISDVKYQDTVTITGTFKNADGNALKNSNVVLYINGEHCTVKTDSNGVFAYEFKASVMGENNLTVAYLGNAKYNACETTTTFTVDKKDTVLTVYPVADVNKGDSVTVTGSFKNADGTAFRNSNVVVYVNGAHHTVKTDSKGNYNYTFTAKHVGQNDVRVVFNGNAKYNACETVTVFKVNE